jgi:transaldolase
VDTRPGRPLTTLDSLRVKIFADGADLAHVESLCAEPWIRGFTTNPTLMRAAGVADYESFARDLLELVPDRPISFEVLADEPGEIERQARLIASWGANVYVKVPITTTNGVPTAEVVRKLTGSGVKVNVTALMTLDQVEDAGGWLADGPGGYVSVFAGRIADSGRDPVPIMVAALDLLAPHSHVELIWASPREVLNVVQADAIGCDVITVTDEILRRLPSLGRDLGEFSLDTVRMFHRDGEAAGYTLDTGSVSAEAGPRARPAARST